MRIAFFVAEFPVLSETFVIRQVAGMLAAGHDVTVIAGQWGERRIPHAVYRDAGMEAIVRAIRRDDGSLPARLLKILSFACRAPFRSRTRRALAVALGAALGGSPASLLDIASLDGSAEVGEFDAIFAHFGPAGVRAMHLQRAGLLHGPLATIFHGFDVSDERTLARFRDAYRALYRHCARLLPISRLWRRRLLDWGAPAERVEVLRMGVDVDRLATVEPRRPLGRPLRLLSVARFTEKKGLRYAIEGALAANRPLRYEIIGDGPLAPELRALASGAGTGKEIAFLGRKSQQEVFAALEQADLFLLPSVTAAGGDMEGVPVALMEAMAKGILVLATRHSGIPELVDDGDTGFLVPERDAAAIAGVIDALPEDPAALARLRCRARGKVEAEFDNARLDAQLERLAGEMAGRPDGMRRQGGAATLACAERA